MINFDWRKRAKLVEMDYCFYNEDPVRPELDNKFRKDLGRKIFGLKLGKDIDLRYKQGHFNKNCWRRQ